MGSKPDPVSIGRWGHFHLRTGIGRACKLEHRFLLSLVRLSGTTTSRRDEAEQAQATEPTCPAHMSQGVHSEEAGSPAPEQAGDGENRANPPECAFVMETGVPIKATLVVAPKSVLPNWKREIEKGVRPPPPRPDTHKHTFSRAFSTWLGREAKRCAATGPRFVCQSGNGG